MQRSMGSQAGQLSSILPTLADDVQDMRTTLTDTLHTIATQAAHVMEVAAQQQEEKGGGHGVSVREVEAVVEQVMQPYSTMVCFVECCFVECCFVGCCFVGCCFVGCVLLGVFCWVLFCWVCFVGCVLLGVFC